ncbi:MAG: insulinase family protein [Clostridia bacterium]|nr:insulinase family protein [Clostridia bacterium]
MQVNDVLHGFKVVRRRENEELRGVLWELEHEKTGAKLAWVDNGCENKLFSVAFKTLPWDDTGVFHILEHSVLAGSENFPLKEPFLDLLKGSMNTFLNAMTFPDKTMYPVSSRNEKDFLNLTKVYLDAVFKPAIYTNPNIFRQEGWHYEIRDKADEPTYKGVVFNEMKGVYSNVGSLLENGLLRLIYPDSVYGFDSGGNPEKIPDLTYERFLDAHREFYHPSNALIYLDGAVPLEKVLRVIDEEYFAGVEKLDKKHEIAMQGVLPAKYDEGVYPIGTDEDEKNKCQIVLGRTIGSWEERKKMMALGLVASYLTDSNDSPLTKAILEKGLAQNVTLAIEAYYFAEPFMALYLRDTEKENLPELRNVIRQVLTEVVEKGIDNEELEALLALEEYSIHDLEEPAGLTRNINGLSSWLYGGDILQYMVHGDTVEAVRKEIGTSYFTDLIREYFLDEAHLSTYLLTPSKTKSRENDEREKARLAAAKQSWTDEETEKYIAENAELDAWQESEDSPEAKATLPKLALSDVDPAPVYTPTEAFDLNGVKVLFHPVPSNGIMHIREYFELNDIPLADLPALRFLTALPGELPTKRHTVSELMRIRRRNIGDFGVCVEVYPDKESADRCRVMFSVFVGALTDRLPEAAAYVHEIMTETLFTDETKIKEILLQRKEAMKRGLVSRGNSFAVTRAARSFSAAAAVDEQLGGYDAYVWLKTFSEAFDEKIAAFAAFADRTLKTAYVPERMILSFTSDARPADPAAFIPPTSGSSSAPCFELKPAAAPEKEAILIPSGVSYAGKAWMLDPAEMQSQKGVLQVLSTLLTYGYLWGEIRVKGGAYGCGFRAPVSSGMLGFYSYRDPAPVEAVDTFNNTPDFIQGFADSDEESDGYVISTVSSLEPLIEPGTQGERADRLWISGKGYEDVADLKRQVLAANKASIAAEIPVFESLAKSGRTCIVGNDTLLEGLDDSWTKYSV